MWIKRSKYESMRAELIEFQRSLAQALNHQFPLDTKEEYGQGWRNACIEIYGATRKAAGDRGKITKPRQSRITTTTVERSDRER